MYGNDDLERLRGVSTAAISDALVMAPTCEKAHHNIVMQTLDECESGLVLAG